MRIGPCLLIGWLLSDCSLSAAEQLLAAYNDIRMGSGGGTAVSGGIHLLSNRDAHHHPIPATYRFTITDPSGLYAIEDRRDSAHHLVGVLSVAPGRTLPQQQADHRLSIRLVDGATLVAEVAITVHVVPRTIQEAAQAQLDRFALEETRLYGRRHYDDDQVASLIRELEENQGAFPSLAFYHRDILSYSGDKGALGEEWEEATNRIGGLGFAYRTSKLYGPGGDAAARLRLRKALQLALERYGDRIPVAGEDVIVGGKPVSPHWGDGFGHLSGKLAILDYNFISHPWRAYDALCGPAIWLMPDIAAAEQTGDPDARRLHEKLVRIFQLCFSNPESYQRIDDENGRWGRLTDPLHSEGAYSDANLGHRLRSWLSLLAIWNDYNRPITYVPDWYAGHHAQEAGAGFLFMPGWTPGGVLTDLHFWVTHFHRPAHQFAQSGFHPDGTVSHHLPGSSDIAMHAYGYGWLTGIINGYELFRDTPFDLGSGGYQFIADRLLYAYDAMIYRGRMDFIVCGRSYSGAMDKFGEEVARDADRLLKARQPTTVITNADALAHWRTSLVDGSQARSGNIPFWVGQFMVHRRGGDGEAPCYFSLKMKNDRTNGAEDFDKVPKSYHAGSGILQVKVRGDEYDGCAAHWDWHALPGLTEEWRTDPFPPKAAWILHGGSPLAGMVSDGRNGCAAMEYRAPDRQYASARADKAVFFIDTLAVAMGRGVARVNPGQGHPIITTVDQTRWVGDLTYAIGGKAPVTIRQGEAVDLSLTMDGPTWVHQGRVGYLIMPCGRQTLHLRGGSAILATERIAGGTRQEGRKGRKAKESGEAGQAFIHVAIGHGVDPSSEGLGAYRYIITADRPAADLPRQLQEIQARLTFVDQDGLLGVIDRSTGMTQLTFFSKGSWTGPDRQTVAVDQPALLQWRREGAAWSWGFVDPRHDPRTRELHVRTTMALAPGTYPYQLGGVHPRPGERIHVAAADGGSAITVELPDHSDDAFYDHQAPLYAGAPIRLLVPERR